MTKRYNELINTIAAAKNINGQSGIITFANVNIDTNPTINHSKSFILFLSKNILQVSKKMLFTLSEYKQLIASSLLFLLYSNPLCSSNCCLIILL
ncbi:hypothetical protein FM115_08520 [Marinilactibacillus psychrotolerans 42ea]|uniref:Uncharacterized protein n=1 Tax=Marinilactibacillus psychrotolerans 42ea TaxID=1255609 RepID=A0A1R4K886_9LACT|nr:hypothetical protein FM115_08520 [Marinilactibacillus psychrotolerans 42ea]